MRKCNISILWRLRIREKKVWQPLYFTWWKGRPTPPRTPSFGSMWFFLINGICPFVSQKKRKESVPPSSCRRASISSSFHSISTSSKFYSWRRCDGNPSLLSLFIKKNLRCIKSGTTVLPMAILYSHFWTDGWTHIPSEPFGSSYLF